MRAFNCFQMRAVFDRAWKSLNKISFVLAPDIERLLDKECQVCERIFILFRFKQLDFCCNQCRHCNIK